MVRGHVAEGRAKGWGGVSESSNAKGAWGERIHALPGDVFAGMTATVPMTVAMEAMYRHLPPGEQYALPPSEIILTTIEHGLLNHELSRRPHTLITLAAHLSYGAAMGALWGPIARRLPLPRAASGALAGIGVWAGSYLVLLPALGILRPGHQWPARRVALLVGAHLVWGVGLRLTSDLVDQRG
jgi:uncharacterized membrane protein YagU involved in acid resistance